MLVANILCVMAKSEPSKLAQTRERLLLCGLELFERQGFDETTVAQIAAAAGVTQMTFFRHFPAKELLIVDDPYDPILAAEIAAQPRRFRPLTRVVRGVRAAWSQLPEPASDLVRRRVRIAASTPSLRAGSPRTTTGPNSWSWSSWSKTVWRSCGLGRPRRRCSPR